MRMDSTRLPKQLLVCRPLCGKRSVGGQKKQWNDLVMCDLKNCDLLADWRDIAKERSTWRALVGEAITDLNGKREKEDVRKKDELKRRRESPVTLGHSTASSTTPSAIACTVQGCSFVGRTKAGLVNHTRQKHGVTAQVHNPCPHCTVDVCCASKACITICVSAQRTLPIMFGHIIQRDTASGLYRVSEKQNRRRRCECVCVCVSVCV